MSDFIKQLTAILQSDPNVTSTQLEQEAEQLVYWTNLPTRGDYENSEDYSNRLTEDERWRVVYDGLTYETYNKIIELGAKPFTNDCEGCENEHVLFLNEVI